MTRRRASKMWQNGLRCCRRGAFQSTPKGHTVDLLRSHPLYPALRFVCKAIYTVCLSNRQYFHTAYQTEICGLCPLWLSRNSAFRGDVLGVDSGLVMSHSEHFTLAERIQELGKLSPLDPFLTCFCQCTGQEGGDADLDVLRKKIKGERGCLKKMQAAKSSRNSKQHPRL